MASGSCIRLPHIFIEVQPRYHVPIIPFMVAGAAVVLRHAANAWGRAIHLEQPRDPDTRAPSRRGRACPVPPKPASTPVHRRRATLTRPQGARAPRIERTRARTSLAPTMGLRASACSTSAYKLLKFGDSFPGRLQPRRLAVGALRLMLKESRRFGQIRQQVAGLAITQSQLPGRDNQLQIQDLADQATGGGRARDWLPDTIRIQSPPLQQRATVPAHPVRIEQPVLPHAERRIQNDSPTGTPGLGESRATALARLPCFLVRNV